VALTREEFFRLEEDELFFDEAQSVKVNISTNNMTYFSILTASAFTATSFISFLKVQ
jgi:hypothetical protein